MNSRRLIKSNIIVTFFSLVSVGVSFLSQMVIAYYFGASAERDAYFSAAVVPTYITTLFVGSFTVICLPFYVALRKKRDADEIDKFISSTLGTCVILLSSLAVVGFLASGHIVSWIAPGFSQEQLSVTKHLFDILVFSFVFQSLSSLLIVFFHVESRFLMPALNPIIVSATSLLSVILFSSYGIKSLAGGVLIGSALSMIVLFPIVWNNLKAKHFFSFITADTATLLKLAAPLFVAASVYKLTTIAERVIASTLEPGSISYLGYSNQIYLVLATVLSGGIATTFYPAMSEAWASGDKTALNNYLSKAIVFVLFLTLPIASIITMLSHPIIKILFERGAFDHQTTLAVSRTLSVFMGAFIFGSLGNVVMKLFYITKRTVAVSIISIIEVFLYIVLGYLLSFYFSYLGLAVAFTISSGFTILTSIAVLLRLRLISVSGISSDFLKLMLGAILCALAAHFSYELLTSFAISVMPALALSVIVSCLTYLATVLYVFKIKDAVSILGMARDYFKKA